MTRLRAGFEPYGVGLASPVNHTFQKHPQMDQNLFRGKSLLKNRARSEVNRTPNGSNPARDMAHK